MKLRYDERILHKFNLERIGAATSVCCNLFSGPINVSLLMKILYLSDRIMLARTLRLIFEDTYINTRSGPILCQFARILFNRHEDCKLQSFWNESFQLTGSYIEPKGEIRETTLSPFEREIIEQQAILVSNLIEKPNFLECFQNLCPEWISADQGAYIPIIHILMALQNDGVLGEKDLNVHLTSLEEYYVHNQTMSKHRKVHNSMLLG